MGKYGRGDDGKSSVLSSRDRIWKDDIVFDALGNLDELNSFLGLAISFCDKSSHEEIRNILLNIQGHIFKIGGMVSSFGSKEFNLVTKLNSEDLEFVEIKNREIEGKLEELRNFILPGGSRLSSILHVCRTVCRRSERSLVPLTRDRSFPDIAIKYINRLSTLLFNLARYANKLDGFEDVIWKS